MVLLFFFLLCVALLLKVYFIFKLERLSTNFLIRKALFKSWLFWAFPFLKNYRNNAKQKMARNINITTAAVWGFFLLVVFLSAK